MAKKLLILSDCGTRVPEFDPAFEVTALPVDAGSAQRLAAIRDAEIIIGEPSLEELQYAPNLKWLQMTWAGADRYLQGGFPKNVILTNASGAFGATIGEHALAMVFSLARRFPAYIRAGKWQDQGSEKQLRGTTALIYGCGDIGSHIARALKALQIRTIGVCREPKRPREGFDVLTTLDCAELFFPEADLVLCALPQSDATAGYFNYDRLSALKNDVILVNVGRGSLIQTEALVQLLQKGKFFGVGLDVLEQEPLPEEHPLWTMTNVIISPHVAGTGFGHLLDTEERIWAICKENLRRYLNGEALRNQVIVP